jgi:threonine synthase
MVVLFPRAEVSDRQRKQMTTLGGNVTVIGIDGKFDDCQALVKQAFADPDLKRIRFSSANSINIGRLLPQAVYYFYGYAQLQQRGEQAVFSIPSGNFGNMCGGMLARRMGLPIYHYIIATNANDEFPKFMMNSFYRKIEPSRVCISNAMNVGHPSNLPRLVALYSGIMDETGRVVKYPDLEALRRELYSVSIGDDETRRTIVETWEKYKVMLEPHGAVGWAGLQQYLKRGYRPMFAVSIETAHPAKFPDEIKNLLGIDPKLPPSLAGLDSKPEQYDTGPNDYAWFKNYLEKKFSPSSV